MSTPVTAGTAVERPYEIVVGLEVHVELTTESKIFCSCPTRFGAEPNSQVCPVCLGLPGTLPVLNRRALEQAVRAALALNCRIQPVAKFDRKNYHYPDLVKGYQISQYDLPVGYEGWLEVGDPANPRRIRIRRVHLEEDTGKSLHDQAPGASVVDYNRSGIPLLEIVSEPDIRSAEEARDYLMHLRQVMLYTGVSDARMEEGSLRVDCNVSVRPRGSDVFGTITEIKNLNSFRSVVRAIEYEAQRQWEVLSAGGTLRRETRHWDERREVTVALRRKEEAHDYRYFPDPDLLPVPLPADWVEEIRASLPELPGARRRRYVLDLDLSVRDADTLVGDPGLAGYFEDLLAAGAEARAAASWVLTQVLAWLNAQGAGIDAFPVPPARLARLLRLVDEGTISMTAAKDVFEEMVRTGAEPDAVVEARGLRQISDQAALLEIVDRVLAANPQPVADYRAGRQQALGFLVGQVMKETRGRANPQLVNDLLRQRLSSDG
ncbi:MAG: Asp-tRNA(Asn)/Glu-tRNA(Gln) amidotransferase subunit GatB [Thermaerobacter sp.]|nr:Asp-tRNA(Asn)/Glu-tRNA(Gln) amidotransferase GatCAB subunit B [Bacillota bacterium]REJ37836.1 MAG: Asp-tRNA(Asn)/Glu-tRNA(Gln) amidotransferase GatCAB subunit B [Bacillota bacterium]